jgi:hypothetical protein
MLQVHDRTNFSTLARAFEHGHAALVEVQRISDGATVPAICAIGFTGGIYEITPFALLIEGNPFELFNPPDPDGGFSEPEASQ